MPTDHTPPTDTPPTDTPPTDTPPTPNESSPTTVRLPTDVPTDATHLRCPYCDRPFPHERLRSLHLGEHHADRLTDEERRAFETAEEDEIDDLFVYHLKVVALLVVVVMGLSYVYAFALA